MFNYILYRIAKFAVLFLPRKLSYAIAIFIADLRGLFAGVDCANLRDNLKAIFPDKTDKEIKQIIRNVFRNFAKYLVDFLGFSAIDKEYIDRNITVENPGYIKQALARGKGVIILTAHLGNWEMGGVAITSLGYPFWVVALEHSYKKTNDIFKSHREKNGIKVIPLRRAAWQALRVIASNGLLGLVGDIDYGGKMVEVEFFGHPALLPTGPAAMAVKTNAVVLPGFLIRNNDDTFTLKMEKPVEFTPSGNNEEDIKNLVMTYKVVFENYIRRYPDQWYMFRRFWLR